MLGTVHVSIIKHVYGNLDGIRVPCRDCSYFEQSSCNLEEDVDGKLNDSILLTNTPCHGDSKLLSALSSYTLIEILPRATSKVCLLYSPMP